MTKHEERIERISELEKVLRAIALLGGNLPDERLTDKTGPNDAVARGLMYTAARNAALRVLKIKSINDLWS
jgi:hypothetical protein